MENHYFTELQYNKNFRETKKVMNIRGDFVGDVQKKFIS